MTRLDGNVSLPELLPRTGGYLWMHQGEGIVGWGESSRIEVGIGSGRFAEAQGRLDEEFEGLRVKGPGPVAFGSFTFDHGATGSVLTIPENFVRSSGGRSEAFSVSDASPPELTPRPSDPGHDFKIRYAGSTISEVEWLEAVARAVKSIASGDISKVVLARDILIWSKQEFDVPILLERLARRFPECYTFAVDGLVGASPELLVRREGRRVSSLVLAGTARRAEGTADEELGKALLASEKDRHEHVLAVDSVRGPFEQMCDRLTVGQPELVRLPNVQHIGTWIEGDLADDVGSLEIAGALHPTAAVCGTPTTDAMTVIRDLEGMERGRYAGPVGWTNAAGDGEWAIALRCAEIDGSRGRLLAGNGMVAASEPEDELEETRLKFKAMMSVLEGA
jgi:menaquinone-specific isochorismate synthase